MSNLLLVLIVIALAGCGIAKPATTPTPSAEAGSALAAIPTQTIPRPTATPIPTEPLLDPVAIDGREFTLVSVRTSVAAGSRGVSIWMLVDGRGGNLNPLSDFRFRLPDFHPSTACPVATSENYGEQCAQDRSLAFDGFISGSRTRDGMRYVDAAGVTYAQWIIDGRPTISMNTIQGIDEAWISDAQGGVLFLGASWPTDIPLADVVVQYRSQQLFSFAGLPQP